MTELDAAKMLCISPRTLWTIRKAGKIGFVKIHAAIRYRTADIEAFAAASTTSGKEAK